MAGKRLYRVQDQSTIGRSLIVEEGEAPGTCIVQVKTYRADNNWATQSLTVSKEDWEWLTSKTATRYNHDFDWGDEVVIGGTE